MKRCFMIGHRDAPETIYSELCSVIEQHITLYGVTEFMVGEHGTFDRMALRAVAQLKKSYPHVKLTLLLAYLCAKQKEKKAGVDELFYPPGMETVPRRYAIARANRYAADWCDCMIAYAWHPASNARNAAEYVQHRAPVTWISKV